MKSKGLAGACHVIRKNINGDIMTGNNIQKEEETVESFTKEDAADLFNELMAAKQDELVREISSETMKQVSKEVPSLVQAELEKLKDTTEPPKKEEEEEEEKEEKEPDEEKEKALADLINKTVKSAVDENIGNLFKDLEKHREPKFKVDDIKEKDLDPQNVDEDKGLTSREIAEKMFATHGQEELIRSLLG